MKLYKTMSSDQQELIGTLAALAKDMHNLGVREMFGVAGDPITPLISSAEKLGIKYLGFRNEQAASYAASAISFLTQRSRIGVCMTVAGPGLTNALTGLANANANQWPCILVCPFTPNTNEFQYVDQLACIEGMAKDHVFYTGTSSFKKAVEIAMTPPFGSVVVFVPKHARDFEIETSKVSPTQIANPPYPKLRMESKLLVVIGGMAPLYPESSQAVAQFVERTGCPFVADPMGRGFISEQHRLCVTAARSRAMQSAATVLVIGGRLDWMLSHGKAPRWSEDVNFILVGDNVGLEGLSSGIRSRCTAFGMNELKSVLTAFGGRQVDTIW